MANCLITQLNALVDNDNLLKIGQVRLHLKSSSIRNYVKITTNTSGTIKVITPGVYFIQNDTPQREVNYGAIFTVPVGEYDVLLDNIYDIISIESFPAIDAPASTFKYFLSMRVFQAYGGELDGKVTDIFGSSMQMAQLDTQTDTLYGDIGEMVLQSSGLRNIAIHSRKLTGYISAIGSLLSLQSASFWGCAIEGSFESVVGAFVGNGKNTGDIALNVQGILNNAVTFGEYNNWPDVNGRLKWNGTTYIVYQLGRDVDVEDVTKNITIYAKGATAEQITDWESKNNTVLVVS